ncbi:MAG: hypothetical protein ACXWLJ_00960 [Rhizomicrobium sp.]
MKLMRGYRFRREAFKMLKAFLLVFIGAFAIEAAMDWANGRSPSMPLIALAASACLFMLVAGVLFAIDAVIQSSEKKKPSFPDPTAHGPQPR